MAKTWCRTLSPAPSSRSTLAPAWLDGREVIAVYADAAAVKPSYLMWLEWTDGRISFIRDYKYVRYVIDNAEFVRRRTPRLQARRPPTDELLSALE